jgi:large subunit ribosomal protein L18
MARKIRKSTDPKVLIRFNRARRIRKKVAGTAERPRLCVVKSNRSLAVQLINDEQGVTLFGLRTPKGKSANLNLAKDLGKTAAAKALSLGIKACVFDRAGNLYHGRIAAVAAGAREGGLQF